MLNYLRVARFQKHLSFAHTFKPGLTVCVGPNWSGKSTLVRAIVYALYGTGPLKLGVKHLASRQQNQMFHVELGFTVGGLPYHLERSPTKAQLNQGDQLVATGQTGVTAAVENLIGLAKSFINYQVAWQGEASALLTLGSARLAQHINAVTGVDVVDQVLEQIRDERAGLKWIKDRSDNAAEQYAAVSARMAELEQRHQAELAQLRQARAHHQQCRAATLRGYARYEDASQRYQAWTEREKGEALRQAELAAVQQLLAKIERSLRELSTETTDDALERLLTLEARMHRFIQQQKHKVELERVCVQLYERQQILPTGKELDVPALREVRNQAEDAKRKAKAELDVIEARVKGRVCPACKRPFDGEEDESELLAEVDAMRDRLHGLTLAAYNAEAAITHAERHNADLRHREELVAELATRQQELAEVKVALQELGEVKEKDLKAAKQAHQKAVASTSNRRMEEYARDEAQQRLAKLQKPLPPVPPASQEEVRDATSAYQGLYQQDQEADVALRAAESRYSTSRTQIKAGRPRLWALRHEATEAAQQVLRDSRLAELSKYLRDNRDRFSKGAWDTLLSYASDFVRQASDGAISALQRDEQGDFTFVEDGDEMPLELASGMQLAILGVAVKLALGAAIGSNFDVLLLDEVSAAASDENALRLTECLAATGQQVFLISHRMADTVPAHDVIELT